MVVISRTSTGDRGWVRMLRVVEVTAPTCSLEWRGSCGALLKLRDKGSWERAHIRYSMSAQGRMRAPGLTRDDTPAPSDRIFEGYDATPLA
jgi:hypothetical protein